MTIDAATVRKVARLARIAQPEETLEGLARELSGIMAWIEQLNEVATDGVEPMTSAVHMPAPMRDDVVTVFVLPPSAQELKSRLIRRAEDSDAVIAERLRNAAEEFLHWNEYDYILVNRDLDKSFARLRAILTAERLKQVKMPNLESFVSKLLGDLKKITP